MSADQIKEISEKTELARQKLRDFANNTFEDFGGIKTSDQQSENEYNSLLLEEYLELIHTYLPFPDLLNDKLLKQRQSYILTNPKLKERLTPGQNICLALIPFTENGLELNVQDLETGTHLRSLMLDDQDMVERGYGKPNNAFYKALPLEVRKHLTFTIPAYDEKFPEGRTWEQQIAHLYTVAFMTIKSMIEPKDKTLVN